MLGSQEELFVLFVQDGIRKRSIERNHLLTGEPRPDDLVTSVFDDGWSVMTIDARLDDCPHSSEEATLSRLGHTKSGGRCVYARQLHRRR